MFGNLFVLKRLFGSRTFECQVCMELPSRRKEEDVRLEDMSPEDVSRGWHEVHPGAKTFPCSPICKDKCCRMDQAGKMRKVVLVGIEPLRLQTLRINPVGKQHVLQRRELFCKRAAHHCPRMFSKARSGFTFVLCDCVPV